MEAGRFASGSGTLSNHTIIPQYLDYLTKSFAGVRPTTCTSSSIAGTERPLSWRNKRSSCWAAG